MSQTPATADERSASIEDAVGAFGPEMYGLALSVVGNLPDAEDSYQAAWVEAIRHWDDLRLSSKRRAWLATIVARKARQASRRRALWRGRSAPLTEADKLAALMTWDPELAVALESLSRRQRAVVALHYGQGYALDEIAGILGCRGGTVRSHLARALEHLREALGHDAP